MADLNVFFNDSMFGLSVMLNYCVKGNCHSIFSVLLYPRRFRFQIPNRLEACHITPLNSGCYFAIFVYIISIVSNNVIQQGKNYSFYYSIFQKEGQYTTNGRNNFIFSKQLRVVTGDMKEQINVGICLLYTSPSPRDRG